MAIFARPRASIALARTLLWITFAWNVAEGIIAVFSGITASSVALVGFGLDSFIEVTAAGILLWRISLDEDDDRAEGRERVARGIIGATFLALAAYIVSQAAYGLATGSRAEESGIGLALAAVATIVMPVLGLAKLRNATRLSSRSLVAESKETLVCSYLSVTLFLGLGANLVAGWWWADVAAALAMVPWIVREGIEGLRGESCDDD